MLAINCQKIRIFALMNFIRNNLANAFTLGNLLSGSIGSIHLLLGNYQVTALCIIISLVLDFFDGFIARALQSNSELGVQLDSLADMVSFGFLPGLVMYKALEPFGTQFLGITLPFELKYTGLLVTLFSCLRLAIFNIDTEQTYSFKGLNTPSNTILLFGLYYAFMEHTSYALIFGNEVFLVLVTLICSWLLVSPVKMIAMKFKSKKWQDNYPKIALLLGAVFILIFFKTEGISLVILYYMLISLVFQKQL